MSIGKGCLCCWVLLLAPALAMAAPQPGYNPQYNSPQVYVNPNASAEQLWQQASILINENQYRAAMPLLLRAAKMGHPRAQAMLGIIYQDGDGVQPNDRTAAYWFGLAAAQGHRAAEYELGAMYEAGEGGLPQNQQKANELYSKSANQGFDKAFTSLGLNYELGDGLPRNRPRAIAYLRRGGGIGVFIANVLSDPHTPARFANEAAFDAYLTRIMNAQAAASWRKAMAPYTHGGGVRCVLCAVKYGAWKASGGGGEPVGPRPN